MLAVFGPQVTASYHIPEIVPDIPEILLDICHFLSHLQGLGCNDRGNPQVFFLIPLPVPTNTVPQPVWLRVVCRGYLQYTRNPGSRYIGGFLLLKYLLFVYYIQFII